MLAVGLALLSASLFGAMTVALRFALKASADARGGALATVIPATVVALGAAAIDAGVSGKLALAALWPFALAGLIAPGGSQILFTLAVREAGPSRASIAVGMAPLVGVAIALVALDEPFRAPLLAGAILVVVGGIALVAERGRPDHVRTLGLVYAGATVILFSTRDNVVRWLARGGTDARPTLAVATTLVVGILVSTLWAQRPPSRLELRAYAPAGILFGLSYISLFEAFYRGRVSVVSPLVATESLWGVGLSVLLLRKTELVGRRLLVGAALIVAGGALIGAFR